MRNDKEVSQAKIRPATIDDANAILEVHYGAVHETADKDYPIEILSEWSPEVDEKRLTDFQKQLREGKDGEKLYVVELENQIAGFGAIVPANQELRAVYVSPMFARRSVGKLILEHLEKEALFLGVKELHLDSSLTAEAFYIKYGYKIKSRGKHKLKSGREMDCVYMFKELDTE